jgi:hypothetical protein
MNKDFVEYGEALELKQLGFDEPCLKFYAIEKLVLGLDTDNGDTNSKLSQYNPLFISAPTFSQAFRWFREKYGYDIHIKGTSYRASFVIGIPLEINNNSKDGHPLVLRWDYIIPDGKKILIYEEAELACLKKLIEIVKDEK